MIPHFCFVEIDGYLLHRITLEPNPGTPDRGICFFNHGQGDYGERYLDVLHPFTERGITCIITDMLGHGRSPGPRGHVGTLDFIDKIIANYMEIAGDNPFGIAGHSMGGLLTLRHLNLALHGKLPMPDYCWVNSPLIKPGDNRAAWFVQTVRILAELAPSITIHTGVTPDMCRHGEAADGKLPKDPASLGHQRVSLSWGVQLVDAARQLRSELSASTCPIPFLFTQGGEDTVCPATYAHQLFKHLHWPNKQFCEFPTMRHETFAEAERHLLFNAIGRWLDDEVIREA